MKRTPKVHFEGAIFHVIARGNHGESLFDSDEDCFEFLRRLESVAKKCGLLVHCWCFMGNHVHMLIEVSSVPIWDAMHRLLQPFARWMNVKRGTDGHLFQGPCMSLLCDTDRYFLELVRYIHLNMVKDGLVDHPDLWKHSSHHQYMGRSSGVAHTERVLEALGGPEGYRAFIAEGLLAVRAKRDLLEEWRRQEAAPGAKVGLAAVVETEAAALGVTIVQIQSGSKTAAISEARHAAIRAAARRGYRFREIAAFLGCTGAAVTKAARKWKLSGEKVAEVKW